jgi:outer membrane lipoprotein-sorting protein
MTATRRTALLALTAVLAAPTLARADVDPQQVVKELTDRAVAYLDGLSAVKGAFQQSNQRGDTANGTFYLARPGRARFQYEPPSNLLITSDGKTVIVSDSRLKSFQKFPLGSTPLALFLADHIRLDRGAHVTKVTRSLTGFSITARDDHAISQGDITLYFNEAPLRLTGWAVVDGQGRKTQVTLGPLSPFSASDPAFFTQQPPS